MKKFIIASMVFFGSCQADGFPCPRPERPRPQDPIPAPPSPIPDEPLPGDNEWELKWEINQERQKRGLPVLTSTEALDCAALMHAEDMSANNMCSHYGSDGSRFWERAKKCGTRSSGEILGCGHTNQKDLVANWLSDGPHAAIMLDKNQVSMGAARVKNMWVVIFMK
jgi:uncharacterized protein YkwD